MDHSGNPDALDHGAQIVRGTAPFGPFSDAMQRRADKIVVVSRFKFTGTTRAGNAPDRALTHNSSVTQLFFQGPGGPLFRPSAPYNQRSPHIRPLAELTGQS
jgi:hypothetical protein